MSDYLTPAGVAAVGARTQTLLFKKANPHQCTKSKKNHNIRCISMLDTTTLQSLQARMDLNMADRNEYSFSNNKCFLYGDNCRILWPKLYCLIALQAKDIHYSNHYRQFRVNKHSLALYLWACCGHRNKETKWFSHLLGRHTFYHHTCISIFVVHVYTILILEEEPT